LKLNIFKQEIKLQRTQSHPAAGKSTQRMQILNFLKLFANFAFLGFEAFATKRFALSAVNGFSFKNITLHL
jgi:hypothetical protein